MKKLLSLCLALTLLITPAMASQAMGWELVRTETTVGPGVSVTTQKLWGDSRSDYRTEQYATYTPGQGALPVVAYGANIPAKSTLSAMAKTLEAYGGRVLAGANGDYFVVATGVPLGMVVTGGVLRSSPSYLPAVGFDANGNAIAGIPGVTVWTDIKGQHLAVRGGYNKTRVSADGLTLFGRDFGAATKGAGEGINVILRPVVVPEDYQPPVYQPPAMERPVDPSTAVDPVTGEQAIPGEEELAAYQAALAAYEAALAEAQTAYETALAASAANLASAPAELAIGAEPVTCVVTGVSTLSGGVAIPEGCFILTVGMESSEYFRTQLSELKVGEQVKLSADSADPRWNDVQQAIGGYKMLLKDGVVQDGLDNTANPRTALGVQADGKVILYTIDGRQSGHSVGASMKQVAARLKELGCVDAVLFDGGGSTTFGATGAADSAFTLQNKPSDGGQRAVTNALFFVSLQKPTGALGSLYITAPQNLFLPGGTTSLTARGIDTAYHPMAETYSDVTYSVSGPGQTAGNVFTAGATAEKTEAIVTATAPGGQQGQIVLTVVPTPHGITVLDQGTLQAVTSLNLDPDQSLDLTASAVWYGLSMTSSDASFTWSVTPEVGTVDANGVLTAGSKAATGTLTVAAGSKSVSVPITVAGHVNLLEDFEDQAAAQVKYGKGALTLRGQSSAELELPLIPGEMDVGLWIYPEAETALTLRVALSDGTETNLPCPVGAPGRWSFVRAILPEQAVAVTGLTAETDGSAATYIDHITSTNGGILDETPPTVKITCENGMVRAALADNVDKTFDPKGISLTLDGKAVDFVMEGNTAAAWVELRDGLMHRISVTAADTSGNLARASVEIPAAADNVSPFADTAGHWAAGYADYLYDRGISKGSPGANGTLLFDPASNITRGDFVTMLMRWMGTDLSQYTGVTLPFADASAIQPWAVDAVKAAYSLGIFTGSGAGDVLYANANDPITRAQAMTLLGRVQPKGYAPSGERFLDQDAIPDWAADHVSVLVGQGVVNGFGGYVRPNDPITRAEVAKVLTVMW